MSLPLGLLEHSNPYCWRLQWPDIQSEGWLAGDAHRGWRYHLLAFEILRGYHVLYGGMWIITIVALPWTLLSSWWICHWKSWWDWWRSFIGTGIVVLHDHWLLFKRLWIAKLSIGTNGESSLIPSTLLVNAPLTWENQRRSIDDNNAPWSSP